MHTLTTDDLNRRPLQLIDDAQRGEPSLVMRGGQAVMLAVPLAARLYDHQQISVGVAARIAGLTYSEMLDELSRCGIAVIRLEPGELERELAAFGA